MPRGKAHPPEVKAAVLAALMSGQGISKIAEDMDIPSRTVEEWAKDSEFAEVRGKKDISELTYGYLDALLSCLTKQATHASAENYVSKQSASDLAVLHGVMADKAFRLLSAMPARTRDGATDESSDTADKPS
jgi:transposase-like protein